MPVAPRQKLEHQEPHAARQMRGEQQYETGLGKLDQRLLAPAQEALERLGIAQRLAEDPEVKRQKNRE